MTGKLTPEKNSDNFRYVFKLRSRKWSLFFRELKWVRRVSNSPYPMGLRTFAHRIETGLYVFLLKSVFFLFLFVESHFDDMFVIELELASPMSANV